MTVRIEARFGSVTLGATPTLIAGPVPTGKRWNIVAMACNHAASTAGLSLVIADNWPSSADWIGNFGDATAPGTAANASPSQVVVSPSGQYAVQTGITTASNYGVTLYRIAGGLSFLDRQLSAVSTLSAAWSRDESLLVVSHYNSTTVSVFRVRGERLTLVTQSSLLVNASSSDTYAMVWTANNSHLLIGQNYTPYIGAFPWDGSTFGTKVTDPTAAPAAVYSIALNPASNAVVAGCASTTGALYAWTGTAWGSRQTYTTPNTMESAAWNPAGTYFFGSSSTSPYLYAFPFTAGTVGTRVDAAGATADTGVGSATVFASGTKAAISTSNPDNGLQVYDFAGTFSGRRVWSLSGTLDTASVAAESNFGITESGTVVYIRASSPYIFAAPVLARPGLDEEVAVICRGLGLAANARVKYSGWVMNAGESLVGWSTVGDSIDLFASGVEITL